MGDLGSTSLFYSARPSIKIDNRKEDSLSEGLQSMIVEETIYGLYRSEMSFGNWGSANGDTGYLYFDRKLFDFGKTISITAGENNTEAKIFEGRIMGIEGNFAKAYPPEILILAEDRFQDLRMTRRSRTFEDMNDEEIIRQVASEHGLAVDFDIAGPKYSVIAQVNQSDLAFIRDRVRSIDAELWIKGKKLYAYNHAKRNGGQVTLTYGKGLLEFSVLADLAGQCSSLVVGGWDVATKDTIAYQADEMAINNELKGGQSGSSILKKALGDRIQRIVHKVPMNDQEAKLLAESAYRSSARQFITGRGYSEGDGRIQVGITLKLQGLGEMFNGTYYVTLARHSFDSRQGYQTYFEVERAGL